MNPQSPSSSSSSEAERNAFEAWLRSSWSRARYIDEEGDSLYCEGWVQGAWVMWNHLRATPPSLPIEVDRSALIDLIEERLTAVYHCTRVWAAWQFGTMTDDDFVEARGTDLAPDIADAVISYCKKKSATLPIDFKQASEQGGWLPIATAPKDGTEILAAWAERELDDEDFPSGRIVGYTRCVTRWVGGCWDEPNHLDAIGTYFDDDTAYEADPSFWQPLPPSPHPEEGALLLGGDEGGKKGGGA